MPCCSQVVLDERDGLTPVPISVQILVDQQQPDPRVRVQGIGVLMQQEGDAGQEVRRAAQQQLGEAGSARPARPEAACDEAAPGRWCAPEAPETSGRSPELRNNSRSGHRAPVMLTLE